MSHKRSNVKWVILGFGAVVIVYLAGVTTWIDQWRGMRERNDYEEFYGYMAAQLGQPSICDKISWAARVPGGFFTAPSYERSWCYQIVAGNTRNPWACWQVRRLGPQNPLFDQLTVFSCVRDAWRGSYIATGVSGENLLRFFRMMGYDPDTLHAEGVTRPIVDVRDIYAQLPREPDLVARIETSLQALGRKSVPAPRDIEDAAFLAQMGALVSKEPRWCQRIPDELSLAGHRHFRDWCMYMVATNIRDGDLCKRIPIRPDPAGKEGEFQGLSPKIAEQMSLHGQCVWHVTSSIPDNSYYGPELPADDATTRRLIELLGYPIPRASTLPAQRLADAYQLFFDELTGAAAPRHALARQRLIERVKALPDVGWDGAPAVDHGT